MTTDARLLKTFHDALLDAFRDIGAMRKMVRFGLDLNLDTIATGPLDQVVFTLLEHADSQGLLSALAVAARAANPGNHKLLAVAGSFLTPEGACADPEARVAAIPRWTQASRRDDIRIVLANYNPRETPVDDITFRIYSSFADRPSWEERFGGGLRKIIAALTSRADTKALEIWLACTPAVAIRTGVEMDRRTSFRVAANPTGHDSLRGSLDVTAATDADIEVSTVVTAAPEIHVLLSVSQDVTLGYLEWVKETSAPEASQLRMRPTAGPSQKSIRDVAHALAWAREVRAQIIALRAAANLQSIPAIRIFFAGSVVLALAIGRELNAMGQLILMDYDRDTKRYVESFTFVA